MSVVPEPVAHVARLLRPDLPEPPAGFSIADLPLSPERKTVYVTLGTVFHQEGGHPHSLFATIISALQDEPITLIMTTGGDFDPAQTGASRAIIAVKRYIPLAAVLPHCDLVVSHGGFGTALGALSYGLPQLNMPLGADQGWNAEHLSDLGAGLMLNPSEAGVEEVRTVVRDLLGTPRYRERAQELQNDLAAMPSPEEVARTVVRLAT
jgi:MGT family glycosyltransferase